MPLSTYYSALRFLMRCMRYRYRTEKLQIRTMLGLDLRGATVLDIGANKGIYCYWMTRTVGALGRVIAFEPQPEMNIAIGRLKVFFNWTNLTVLNIGLSSIDGVAYLARDKVGDGSASVESSRRRDTQEILSIPVTRLDAAELDLKNLKFIKCDVEGHEHDVFRGAEHIIRTYRPVVQFEAIPDDAQNIFDFFIGLGYSGVMLLGGRYLNYSRREAHYKFGLAGHRDFLFFPPEAIGTTIGPDIYRQFPAEVLRRG